MTTTGEPTRPSRGVRTGSRTAAELINFNLKERICPDCGRSLADDASRMDSILRDLPPGIVRAREAQAQMERLAAEFCRVTGVSMEQYRSRSRAQPLAALRQVLMTKLYDETQATAIEVGAFLNRDHSTVIGARHAVYDRRARNAQEEEG